MNEKQKTISASRCVMTEIVLPNDTNGLGNMMGGRLMYLMDKCAAISAQRHANRVCVTASVDTVEFRTPIREGEILTIEGCVTRVFRSSMEVQLVVTAENALENTHRVCNRAFFTFVAIDDCGRSTPAPQIYPETPTEQVLYNSAAKRREARLYLSRRLRLEDSTYLLSDLLSAIASFGVQDTPS